MAQTTSRPDRSHARMPAVPGNIAGNPGVEPQPPARPLSGSLDAAILLLSETAHDLRAPLTAIRESVRLVHDEELGRINDNQRLLLSDVIGQCNRVDQIVGDMLPLYRFHRGRPRAQRSWIPLAELREAIDETLRPWTLPRHISVIWNSDQLIDGRVFADPQSLCRLIINLVSNAIRVTADGGTVMIVLRRTTDGDAIRWSVRDSGKGFSQAKLRAVVSQQGPSSGGEGLGLTISRQIAAAHFSALQITSRSGIGTEISFQTPSGGPASVARCWMRWREQFRAPETADSVESEPNADRMPGAGELAVIQHPGSPIRPPRQTRLPSTNVDAELHDDSARPRSIDYVAVGTVSLGAAMSRDSVDHFDLLFQQQLGLFDLAYQIDRRCWAWILDADRQQVADRIEAITAEATESIKNLRLHWSRPRLLPIAQRRSVAIVSDLLVRRSLEAEPRRRLQDSNQVRLGSAPIQPSPMAAFRLDQEVRRLTNTYGGRMRLPSWTPSTCRV